MTNSRYNLRERPLVAPGRCVACSCYDRPVVDFGVDIPAFGAIYICVDCIQESADAFLPDKDYFALSEENELLRKEKENAESRLADIVHLVSGWDGGNHDPVVSVSEDSGEDESGTEGSSSEEPSTSSSKKSDGVPSDSVNELLGLK